MNIKGKHALVTGGAIRVGREISLTLAKHGANIHLHYNSSKSEAEKTAAEIKALGVECVLIQADLSKESDVLALAKKASSVDILVNSASIFYKTPIESVKPSDFDKMIAINLKAPFLLAVEIGKQMQKKGGKIINICDWSGMRPYKDYAPYCASKGALITFTKSLARDFAPKVFANGIAPGPVMLPSDFTEHEAEAIKKLTAVGRIGTPQDVANAVVFLGENDFINGTVLVVDGGRSIV